MDTTNAQQTRERVLILDDEPSQLKTLTALLEAEGFCVLACSRAAKALDALAQGGVAVAIVDLRLPDLSTGDLLNALVAWSDRVPIIIHTAFASYESARDALNAGAFAYVEKVGNPEAMVRHVHRAIHSRLRRHAEQLEQAVESRTRELQKANAALRESEDRFRSLFATSLDAVLLTLPDGRILSANEAACQMFRRSEEELIQVGRSGVVDASDPRLTPGLEERARTGRFCGELMFVRKDGATFPGEVSSAVFTDRDGQVRTSMVIRDISERQRMEESLQESERKFRRVVETAIEGVWFLDREFKTTEVNDAVVHMLGYSPEELIGRPFIDLLFDEDRALQSQEFRRRERGLSGQYERRLPCKEGGLRWLFLSAKAVMNAAGAFDGSFAMVTDITDRKVQEQKVLDYQRQLKALASELTLAEERLRRDVAAHVHDDISQTLAMSKVQVEALCEAVSDDPLRTALAGIAGSLEQTLRDARDLTAQLSYPTLTVLGLAKAVEKWLREEVGVKHGLETVFEDDLEDKPLDDDVRAVLFRSVRELLTNVVKHAHATRVAVSMERKANQVVTVIQDNGVGCDPEEIMTHSHGFGLLSIRESLERLGGTLSIESQHGVGCKITLVGPLKLEARSESEVNT